VQRRSQNRYWPNQAQIKQFPLKIAVFLAKVILTYSY
jgi:hypothetical protein